MSPPIFTPDGSEVREIVLPDGSTASEVVAPDGSVVFDPIPDSLISYWTFDDADTSGSTAIDTVGSNDGTINGATTGVSGANEDYATNEAYSFNGIDDFVDVGTLVGSGDQSVACWINPDTLSPVERAWIYGAEDTDGGLFSVVLDNNGSLAFAARSGKGLLGVSNSLSAGSWSFIVAVHDASAGAWTLYEDDATELASVSSDGTYTTISEPYAVACKYRDGTQVENRFFPGDIDDVRVYNKPLSQSEVSNLYNNGSI
jgi:hypothetical protein